MKMNLKKALTEEGYTCYNQGYVLSIILKKEWLTTKEISCKAIKVCGGFSSRSGLDTAKSTKYMQKWCHSASNFGDSNIY